LGKSIKKLGERIQRGTGGANTVEIEQRVLGGRGELIGHSVGPLHIFGRKRPRNWRGKKMAEAFLL